MNLKASPQSSTHRPEVLKQDLNSDIENLSLAIRCDLEKIGLSLRRPSDTLDSTSQHRSGLFGWLGWGDLEN